MDLNGLYASKVGDPLGVDVRIEVGFDDAEAITLLHPGYEPDQCRRLSGAGARHDVDEEGSFLLQLFPKRIPIFLDGREDASVELNRSDLRHFIPFAWGYSKGEF